MKKILLTGGGTAGHVIPVILVAQQLKDYEILYAGSRQGIEKKLVPAAGIKFKKIAVGKKRAYFSIWNLWDYFKTFVGIVQSFFIIMAYRPDAIFAKGGFVTFPVVFWANIFKIPLIIHESDAVLGRANRWAAKFANKICLGFAEEYYPEGSINDIQKKVIYTGTPVREEFFTGSKSISDVSSILFMGGSQGSLAINRLVLENIGRLTKKYQVEHIVGSHDYKNFSLFSDKNYKVYEYYENIEKLITGADLIVSRAGASSIFEIAAANKPSIIIPLESSANDHQVWNAKILERKNAAKTISEKEITAEKFFEIIENLNSDKTLREKYARNISTFAKKDSAEVIASVILDEIK